jgi:hypothetical protein
MSGDILESLFFIMEVTDEAARGTAENNNGAKS